MARNGTEVLRENVCGLAALSGRLHLGVYVCFQVVLNALAKCQRVLDAVRVSGSVRGSLLRGSAERNREFFNLCLQNTNGIRFLDTSVDARLGRNVNEPLLRRQRMRMFDVTDILRSENSNHKIGPL